MKDKSDKSSNKIRKKPNNEIMKVTFIFFGLFFVIMAYFFYFQVFESSDVINNPYNKRQDSFTQKVVRGIIYGSNKEILAQTVVDDEGNETRQYPYNNLFAQTVGISTHGKLGLESAFNFNLLTSNADITEKIMNEFKDEKNIGDNIITTLDVNLQQTAYDALGDNKGAVVVIEPETGKVLAMVSKPDFNPNQIDSIWDSLTADNTQSALVNRGTQGLYAPGSTFKIFTLLEYIRENPDYGNYSYTCTGSFSVDNHTIDCFNKTRHGKENLLESFADSCNSSFSNIGLSLDLSSYGKLCKSLLFNSELPLSIAYNQSSFALGTDASAFDITQTSIGQGKTLVSPVHMAMIASALANDGVLMSPYLVDHTENYTGDVVKEFKKEKYGTLFTTDETNILREYMRAVITQGTGKKLNSDLYTAYGKTGTAETGIEDSDHSWFVGYAENGEKKVAICVVMENMNPGTSWSVNASKSIFDYYFSR